MVDQQVIIGPSMGDQQVEKRAEQGADQQAIRAAGVMWDISRWSSGRSSG